MKKPALIFTISLLAVVTSFGQFFEGKIIYTNSYKSKIAQITDEQLTDMLGSTQEYLIKGGNYKSMVNGSMVQWQLYNNKDNRLYSKMAISDIVFWNDAGVQENKPINVKVNKNATEILGYKCDEVILTCESGVEKYYFNSTLSVDTKLFEKHKYGNWFDYLSASHALPLKSILETAEFSLVSEAKEVKPMKLADKEFALPSGIKIVQNPE